MKTLLIKMNHSCLVQTFLILSLLLSLTSEHALFHDELDFSDDTDSYSDAYPSKNNYTSYYSSNITFPLENEDSLVKISDMYKTYNDMPVNKRQVLQRSILNQLRSYENQRLLDLLRKAYNQGWKPHLKHYLPATRFGR